MARSVCHFNATFFLVRGVVRSAVFVRFSSDASGKGAGDGLRSLRSVGSSRCTTLELCTELVCSQCSSSCLLHTRVTRVVLPAPLGPSRINEGTTTAARWRYRNKWKMMGSDSDNSNVKSMAPMVGLKLQVSHSRAVFMSTAMLVSVRMAGVKSQRQLLTTPKLADRAACVSTLRPEHAPAEIWGTSVCLSSLTIIFQRLRVELDSVTNCAVVTRMVSVAIEGTYLLNTT